MADPVAHEMSREAANVLVRARDSGQLVGESELQEELGVGRGDLEAILEQLRSQGLAVMEEPGRWAAASAGAEDGAEPRVEVEVPSEPEPGPLVRDDGAAARALHTLMPEPTVRLTFGIARALDESALGKIVKAALEDLGADDVFLLEIGP